MKKILLILVAFYIQLQEHMLKNLHMFTVADYILNKIPEFKQAQDKLDAFSSD